MKNKKTARRGVLLLLILSLLAMFGMVAVAFVVLSSQAGRTARLQLHEEQVYHPVKNDLDEAAMQVLRGPSNAGSKIGPHSLLEDIYGNGNSYVAPAIPGSPTDIENLYNYGSGPIPARITISNFMCGNQLTEITYQLIAEKTLTSTNLIADPLPFYRIGCPITFVSGQLKGITTRIVSINPTTGNPQIITPSIGQLPQANDAFIINGMPFSGTGFGYDMATGTLNTLDIKGRPIALQPYCSDNLNPLGGANEDYDAADYQNVMLGAVVTNNGAIQGIIPSMHKPALINYWYRQLYNDFALSGIADPQTRWEAIQYPILALENNKITSPSGTSAYWPSAPTPSQIVQYILETKRKIMSRPLPEDHPNFNGSNPTSTAFYYDTGTNTKYSWECGDTFPNGFTPTPHWDVDTDGDGIPDSNWMDIGLPIRTLPDGRKVKPLVAILCLDMDGRLNLNAHGNNLQTVVTNPGTQTTGDYYLTQAEAGFAYSMALANVRRGQGWGPAEINLAPLFSNTPATPTLAELANFQALLQGRNGFEGRYGSNQNPGSSALDLLVANKYFDMGDKYYWNFANLNNSGYYGSPWDFSGAGMVGTDAGGRPLYSPTMGQQPANSPFPYQLNLSQKMPKGLPTGYAVADNPFSVSELERLLRRYDRDAPILPNRLDALEPDQILSQYHRIITTESWDVPVASPAIPNGLMTDAKNAYAAMATPPSDYAAPFQFNRSMHIADLLRAKLIRSDYWQQLLPPEIISGLKYNLNRPNGNGRDDNANGTVDDPFPASGTVTNEAGETVGLYYDPNKPVANATVSYEPANYLPTGTFHPALDALQSRQLQARYLYVMAMLLTTEAERKTLGDRLVALGEPNDATDPQHVKIVTRYFAQWAINVVSFRDRSSIMIPFEYDPNPFPTPDDARATSGRYWRPDGDLSTNDIDAITPNPYVVWGCKKPELLIAETLTFHDRRTQDTDDGGGKVGGTPADTNGDYDQVLSPIGSLFVKLYNPAGSQESYDQINSCWAKNIVSLDQVTADGSSPVWRLAIVNQAEIGKDPEDPIVSKRPTIERSIYFVDPTASGITGDGQANYPSKAANYPSTANLAPLRPGRYAVLGPSATTYIGDRTDNDLSKTRRIELVPNSDPDDTNEQVKIISNLNENDGTTNELSAINHKKPIAIIMDKTRGGTDRRFSVSEPVGGYPVIPDTQPADRADAALMLWGTTPNYKVVHLQRLANPMLPYQNNMSLPNYNPYLTIDSQPIDITAFNGKVNDAAAGPTKDTTVNSGTVMFASHQRGETNVAADDGTNNLWKVKLSAKTLSASDPGLAQHIFDYQLKCSLGYLNTNFGTTPLTGPDPATNPFSTLGDPPQPFPWFAWNGRPYISELELLLVPAWSPSKLLANYSINPFGNIPNPYEPTSDPNKQLAFKQTMNFFDSNPVVTPGVVPELHRLLDYVGVPSRFVGTEIQANANNAGVQVAQGEHFFHPPFNRIPLYREPGKINLNTIYDEKVFTGLMNNFCDNTAGSWQDFIRTRRGYGASGNILDTYIPTNPADPTFPTQFAKPFRSAGSSYHVPQVLNSGGQNILAYNREINATLLRAGPVGAGTPDLSDPMGMLGFKPLFQTFDSTNVMAADNVDRNPFFRYESMERLANLTTTRSNVYAVWITVGYFEVSPARIQPWMNQLASDNGWTAAQFQQFYFKPTYPDGYELGQELGSDTGEIERHRGFYIIDRSIPVGFQRGQDLNAEKAFLLKRVIQ